MHWRNPNDSSEMQDLLHCINFGLFIDVWVICAEGLQYFLRLVWILFYHHIFTKFCDKGMKRNTYRCLAEHRISKTRRVAKMKHRLFGTTAQIEHGSQNQGVWFLVFFPCCSIGEKKCRSKEGSVHPAFQAQLLHWTFITSRHAGYRGLDTKRYTVGSRLIRTNKTEKKFRINPFSK